MFENIEKLVDANLKNFCTFKIGGRGTILFPKNQFEVKRILNDCKKNSLEFFILGNGSNVLFPDDDFKKIVIDLRKLNNIKITKQGTIMAEAGVRLFAFNKFLEQNSLAGFEWSYGIPATIGGLTFMNGGAFGEQVANYIKKVKILKNGKISWINRKNIDFSYRKSNIEGIILAVEFKFKNADSRIIAEEQRKFFDIRKKTQPYDKFSAGSVFKRFGDKIPAIMIDKAGLKGVKIGGAEISTKHAGFIVNNGDATSKDVKDLICLIKKRCGNFECEIIILE